ncbi:uncharacterized protein FIBRA_07327 [Fibroporia radiculosa]|uniref:Aminotransferase class I/classII large domain-containing protein n=1 Tax=Fibroporia radiculosa TaxID=599839 RepID=J4H4J9_9APHY|nr:uncharacterized protein FIBRA_07327 [Fibroporia radiculosa]CCM05119.1 predicted protein [Fibroporia radiculosa]
MSQGVPGVPPPKSVLDALSRTSSDPTTCGYVPNAGELSLRKAIADEMKFRYGDDADIMPEDIALTAGCNLAFFSVATTLADAGDEMIIPIPWYFNHEMTLTTLNIKPVILPTRPEDAFMPSPERCERLITPKTKAIVLVTPNNPTGAVYPPSLISAFADLARKYKIALVIDETYRDFITSGPPHHLFSSSAPVRHRLGLVCASPSFISHLNTALDSIQICAPRPPQRALAPLLPSLRTFIRETADAVAHRHTLFREVLPKRWCIASQGGYYAFVRHPFVGISASKVCQRLAEELGVVCLPAEFFGPKHNESVQQEPERWVRFSVANVNDEKVKLVCKRLAESETAFGWSIDPKA